MNEANEIGAVIRQRMAQLSEVAPGSIGDMLHFQLISCDPLKDEYLMTCQTESWMRNVAGTLHGGLCATILDQAMGFVSFCVKPGDGTAPTVQLQVDYHRPLIPGEEVLVKVRVLSVTRSLLTLTAEAMHANNPEKICLSGSGIYFYKPAQ